MKKLYVCISIAVLAIAFLVAAGMAADIIQKDSSGSGHASASQLSAQAFKHKQWVWVPGVATQINWVRDGSMLETISGAEKNYCYLDLKASANDVEVSVPVPLAGGKKYVKKVMLCSDGETNNARIDKMDIYDGNLYLASASGTDKFFEGYQENTFDFGSYYAVDRGLTVVLYVDNWDSANSRSFWIDAVGAETRW